MGLGRLRRQRHTAEPPVARGKFGKRRRESGAIEIRPMNGQEDELAIGRLPHQEIGQSLLARCADDEIGIGNAGRVEMLFEHRLIYGCGINEAGRHFIGDEARRRGDFLPAAVVECDDQSEACVGARQRLRFVEQRENVGLEFSREPMTLILTPLL